MFSGVPKVLIAAVGGFCAAEAVITGALFLTYFDVWDAFLAIIYTTLTAVAYKSYPRKDKTKE